MTVINEFEDMKARLLEKMDEFKKEVGDPDTYKKRNYAVHVKRLVAILDKLRAELDKTNEAGIIKSLGLVNNYLQKVIDDTKTKLPHHPPMDDGDLSEVESYLLKQGFTKKLVRSNVWWLTKKQHKKVHELEAKRFDGKAVKVTFNCIDCNRKATYRFDKKDETILYCGLHKPKGSIKIKVE